ncbi:MAG: hypothetical protein OER95_07045 [Acidimicrobiia bacterium]|nr:hypothetical protein [Acidimicrobiia bacterium]
MSQDRWQEVKDKVEGLGLKLKLHLEQEHEESEADTARRDARAALEEMGAKLQDAVDSLGNAAKDPAIRSDVKDLGLLLRDVMNETLSTVGAGVGELLKKTKGEMASGVDDTGADDDSGADDEAADDTGADDEVADDGGADDEAAEES